MTDEVEEMRHEAIQRVRELATFLDGRSHGHVATPAQLRLVCDMADAARLQAEGETA